MQVVQTMRKARHCLPSASTSPLLGTLTLYYADGVTNQFFLSPSARFSGLEIANGSSGYVISMSEMLGAFERVGLLAKDQK